MTCPSCGTTNPSTVEFCEVCGTPLAPRAAPAGAPADPGRKRRTLYDPGTPKEAAPDDVFLNPPPPRPAFDAADPFRGSIRTAIPAPPPAAPPAAPPPGETRNRTVYDAPATAPAGLRGVLVVGGAALRLVPLAAGRTSIGRDADNDVVIEDGKVSGNHGYLYLRDEGASFIDVSRNGSVVDGEPILGEPRPVKHGSVLGIGGVRCVVLLLPDDAAQSLMG